MDDELITTSLTATPKMSREEQESIELARQLMAEEAMAVYHNSVQYLRDSAEHLSREDFEALQAALAEEERDQAAEQVAHLEDDEGNLSYDTLLQIGDRIGDVKSERWAMESASHINQLPVQVFIEGQLGPDADDSEHKCLVCQCEYEEGDELRRLPCSHCFHRGCVDQWLKSKDVCPYCRVSIVPDK